MKAITIKQPYATLIAEGLKEYEFRTWKTKYRGEILIHAGCGVDKEWLDKVKDYGIGIPSNKLDTIFDGSCYVPESSSDSHRGMGIGLSICKTIIVAHNGQLTAANHKKGCEFIFTLPLKN